MEVSDLRSQKDSGDADIQKKGRERCRKGEIRGRVSVECSFISKMVLFVGR